MRRALLLSFLLAPFAAAPRASADEPPAAPPPVPAAERPGRLGFSPVPIEALGKDECRALGLTAEHGTVLFEVVAGGPADKAGLARGDILLSIAGKDVPPSDTPATYGAWSSLCRALTAGIVAGQSVKLVALREGKRLEVTAVAADADTILRLRVDPALAGEPTPFQATFEGREWNFPPAAGLHAATGNWTMVSGSDPEARGRVLRQDQPTDPWAVALFVGRGRALADGKASVRFRPVSGREDASGGVIFRAKDPKNYYLVRANGDEDNFRLYSVKDGVRWQLGGVTVTPPALGTWHAIEVTFKGTALKATLDGKDPVEAKDDLFSSGWCGLWTKADSVTEFDDFSVTPEPKPAAPPSK